jgi:hypothetical protein
VPERMSSKGWGKGVGSGGRSVGIVGGVDSRVEEVGDEEVEVGVEDDIVDRCRRWCRWCGW